MNRALSSAHTRDTVVTPHSDSRLVIEAATMVWFQIEAARNAPQLFKDPDFFSCATPDELAFGSLMIATYSPRRFLWLASISVPLDQSGPESRTMPLCPV
jgi:hypothetical protein